MATKNVGIPNIPFCLKILKELIKAVPDAKDARVNFKSLSEKKRRAEQALDFLERIMGKGARVEAMQPCDHPRPTIPQ